MAYSLENLPAEPAASALAYETIRPSVVLVRRLVGEGDDQVQEGMGTGVVVVDTGAILTSLHVVILADQIQVVFADGHVEFLIDSIDQVTFDRLGMRADGFNPGQW